MSNDKQPMVSDENSEYQIKDRIERLLDTAHNDHSFDRDVIDAIYNLFQSALTEKDNAFNKAMEECTRQREVNQNLQQQLTAKEEKLKEAEKLIKELSEISTHKQLGAAIIKVHEFLTRKNEER